MEGAGNLERFDYWLDTFRYLRATARVRCVVGSGGDERARAEAFGEVYRYLLATVKTPGEMGTVANWEQHVIDNNLRKSKVSLPKEYRGPPRLIVPTVRTVLARGEALRAKAIVLGAKPAEAALHWRPMGEGTYRKVPLEHVARGVYRAELPPEATRADLEYHIRVATRDGATLRFPVTAPVLNQTVVVMSK